MPQVNITRPRSAIGHVIEIKITTGNELFSFFLAWTVACLVGIKVWNVFGFIYLLYLVSWESWKRSGFETSCPRNGVTIEKQNLLVLRLFFHRNDCSGLQKQHSPGNGVEVGGGVEQTSRWPIDPSYLTWHRRSNTRRSRRWTDLIDRDKKKGIAIWTWTMTLMDHTNRDLIRLVISSR